MESEFADYNGELGKLIVRRDDVRLEVCKARAVPVLEVGASISAKEQDISRFLINAHQVHVVTVAGRPTCVDKLLQPV